MTPLARRLTVSLTVLLPTLAVPVPALAYGGPGSVVTGIGALLAALAALAAALFGFFWFPVKRLVQRLRGGDDEEDPAEAS